VQKFPEVPKEATARELSQSVKPAMVAAHAASSSGCSEHSGVEDNRLLTTGAIREADYKAVIQAYSRNEALRARAGRKADCAPVMDRSSRQLGGRKVAEPDRERRARVGCQCAGCHQRQNQIVIPACHNEGRWPRTAFGRLKAVREKLDPHGISDWIGNSGDAPPVEIALNEFCLSTAGRCGRKHCCEENSGRSNHIVPHVLQFPALRPPAKINLA